MAVKKCEVRVSHPHEKSKQLYGCVAIPISAGARDMSTTPCSRSDESTRTVKFMIQVSRINTLPETGFVRQAQILGDPRRGIPGPIPVGTTTWWAWVKSGRAPKPIKLGPCMTVWRAEEIHTCRSDEFQTVQGADGGWPQESREASVALSGQTDDEAIAVQLLTDIRNYFAREGNPPSVQSRNLAAYPWRPPRLPPPAAGQTPPLSSGRTGGMITRRRRALQAVPRLL